MSSKARVLVKIPKLNIPYKYVEPALIHVNQLVPHEEIVEGRLRDIIEQFKRDDAVDMPIVVAPIPGTDKYLIVDGHHRWAAVKEMGYSYVPCVVVDYFSSEIKLHTWYPAIKGSIKSFLEVAGKTGLSIEKCSFEASVPEDVLSKYSFIVIGGSGECYAIRGGVEEQKTVSKILSELNMQGEFTIVYYGSREDALEDLVKGDIDYVFLRKSVTKEEVMEMARRNEVYAPKTTRHILPYYPAKTYTPLDKLR